MISSKLQQVINDQITAELWSSNLYLSMSFHLAKEGWDGAASWMLKQAEEEKGHALSMAHYLIERGGQAKVSMIDVVPEAWGSVLEVFEHVYTHECHVSALINKCLEAAKAENDYATEGFYMGFVKEQVEEESTAAAIVDKIKKAGEAGMLYLDAQLGQRK